MKKQLNEVYVVRAIASLMVCIFHVCGSNLFSTGNILKTVSSYGYLGVEMFFILTGFIILYSIPSNYTTSSYGTFISKRLIRIEPPYLISIVLVLILNTVSHSITGKSNTIDPSNILYHLGYLNNFGFGSYISPVYWTLGIEFQFYILIGLLFTLINKRLYAFLLAAFFLNFIPVNNISIISNYLPYFCLGILLFYFKIKKQVKPIVFITLSLVFLFQLLYKFGIPETLISLLTILILIFNGRHNKIIKFFSDISFSLYLTHVIIGGKVINIGLRYATSNWQKYGLAFLAISISIAFAYIFYRIVEKPFFILSKKIKYEKPIKIFSRKNKKLSLSSISS